MHVIGWWECPEETHPDTEINMQTPHRTARDVQENNWLLCPSSFPVKPCFYQDFEEEIPEEYRRICRRMYYLWMCESDSSFSFFFFFFVFFFQVVVYIIQTVGIPGWGNSMIQGNLPVAVTMMVVAGFFTVNSVLGVILLKLVHSSYRRTGASFTKAQEEFSQGVLTNRTFQSAASSAATNAAQGVFSRN
ncbi:hypothetical protein WMY93_012890 [Mugilogobius chulae]|uniref:Secretory carrier-associated membrane protein n=1 Tax=Mugilogobius chulae TaxID=88201 RepID=A0AAW0P1Y6_9GOBI